MPNNESRLITTKEAALMLGLAKNTLEKYRSIGNKGPKFIRMGKNAIRYRISDIEKYISECCFSATCEYA